MKVYTKTGDKGQTSLVGGQRVSKCCERLESYGTVDELNSHVGLLISMVQSSSTQGQLRPSSVEGGGACQSGGVEKVGEFLLDIQGKLFVVGGYLATDNSQREVRQGNIVTSEMVEAVELEIDRLQELLPPLRLFILPGGTMAAGQAHVCRTVCRRAERCILRLAECGAEVDELVLSYVNRLSDYFFVLARWLNVNAGVEDIVWRRK